VRLVERLADLRGDVNRLIHVERAELQLVRQQLAFDVLHGDEQRAVALADVVDGRDVRRAQHRGGARLSEKPLAPLRVVLERGRQQLERHTTTEPRVFDEVDLAHAARAQLL
jgi:hypothetical protein